MRASPPHHLVDAGAARVRVVGDRLEFGGEHDIAIAYPGMPVGEPELLRRARTPLRGPQVDQLGFSKHLVRLAAVATGVHPYRATNRAGYADVELEPGESGGRGPPGDDGQRHTGAGAHHTVVGPELDRFEDATEHDRDTRKAAIGDEQVRTTPDDEHRHRTLLGRRSDRLGERQHVLFGRDPHENRDRAAEPVGRETAHGHVALDCAGKARRERGRDVVEVHGWGSRASHTSGTVVRSPALSIRSTSPERARSRA